MNAEELKLLRNKFKLTQDELAKELDVHRKIINEYKKIDLNSRSKTKITCPIF